MIFLRFVLALAFVAGQVEIRADGHSYGDSDENKACDGHSCTRRFTFINIEEAKDEIRKFMREALEKHQPIPCTTKPQETTVTKGTISIAPTMNDESTTAAHPTIDEVSTTAAYPTMNEESTTATTVTKETNMETALITAVMNYESTTTAHPTTNEESTMAAHPTTNEDSTTTAHPTTNEESTMAAHPTTNEESTTATHPTMNDESTTIKDESTTASNPRMTGGTAPSCQDACMPSSLSNDSVVNGKLKIYGEEGRCKCRCKCRIFIQIRNESNQISFARNLTEYQQGFGDWSGDYWLGLDLIHAVTNRTGGVNMGIYAFNNQQRIMLKFFASGVHVAAESENYRLTMLDTRNEAMRQMNGSIFEVKNIGADGCTGVSGWWFGDISGGSKNDKWCNPNGPYMREDGIKWRKYVGTLKGVGNEIYTETYIALDWFTPRIA